MPDLAWGVNVISLSGSFLNDGFSGAVRSPCFAVWLQMWSKWACLWPPGVEK